MSRPLPWAALSPTRPMSPGCCSDTARFAGTSDMGTNLQEMKMRHCMIDLETLGTKAGSVILSIGATMFGEGYNTGGMAFHEHLNLEAQISVGMSMDPSTILWWMEQKDPARAAILAGQKNAKYPSVVLEHFAGWLTQCKAETVWGNGADFDLPLLSAAYVKFGMKQPWKYNAGRCVRTVMQLTGKKLGDFGTPVLLAHDALSDAVFQAAEVEKALEWLAREHNNVRRVIQHINAGAESQ